MKHPKIKFKIFVVTKKGSYFLYFRSLVQAEAFARNELQRAIAWLIRDVDTNEIVVWSD